jgi:hypothetical protein
MTIAQAPLKLPFAPKPFRRELSSSWLLRLAAANCVTLDELLSGFEASYPTASYAFSLDLNLKDGFLKPMACFSRISFKTLSRLRLEKQVSKPEAALLLRFGNEYTSSRQTSKRLGYAFCPSCIVRQNLIHVTWEWAFAYLQHCAVHRTPLCVGCPLCGDPDPLPFGSAPVKGRVCCQSCGANLHEESGPTETVPRPQAVFALESGYRAALLGTAQNLSIFEDANSVQFRRFVDDTLQLAAGRLDERPLTGCGRRHTTRGTARRELTGIITQLVVNASTDCDLYERRARYRKSLKLWQSLLVPLPREDRQSLARVSEAWPSFLRRRLAAAIPHSHRRKPHLSGVHASPLGPRFEYKDALKSAI